MGTGPGATPSHCAPRWMGATVLTFFRRKYAGLNFKGSCPARFHVNKLKRLNGGIIAVGDKRDFPRFSVLISIVCVQIYWCEDFSVFLNFLCDLETGDSNDSSDFDDWLVRWLYQSFKLLKSVKFLVPRLHTSHFPTV